MSRTGERVRKKWNGMDHVRWKQSRKRKMRRREWVF
jgi:hypothetical protein